MKPLSKILGISLTAVVAFFGYGCSNDLDLEIKGESIPIVYCLLNPLEEVQYVRVGKSFFDSDSLSWPNHAEVYIEKWQNNNAVETFVFDISTINERDTGQFPVDGLKVYEAEFQPEPGQEYHLFVYYHELDKIVSGVCIVMSIPEVIDPEIVPGRTVSFDTISPFTLRWNGGDHAGVYQGIFKMNYSESLENSYEVHACYFTTPLYIKSKANYLYEEELNGNNFFQAVENQIKPVPGIKREIINFEFLFYSGGLDLALLINSDLGVSNPFALVRNTSNVSGGKGVFSSISCQRFPNLEPSATTKYFLATSPYTKELGFQISGL